MPTTITTIRTVAVPAQDQDKSVAFFTQALGFEKRMDAELSAGFRWIEVAPPGSAVSVAIVAASPSLPSGIDTGIRFVTTDAEAEHASMERNGVDVGDLLRWPGVPLMFSFRDIDGNVFYLAEAGMQLPPLADEPWAVLTERVGVLADRCDAVMTRDSVPGEVAGVAAVARAIAADPAAHVPRELLAASSVR